MPPRPEFALLLPMSHERRAAFAAGVIERVFGLYEDCATPCRDDVREAITAAWDRACGEVVSEATADRLAAALDEESGDYCDVPTETIELPFGVIVAAKNVLAVALTGDTTRAENAAGFARDDIARAVYTHGDPDDLDARDEDELRWQIEWLHQVSTADPKSAREAFAAHSVTEPAWQSHWET
ncbi:hypothetical protein ACWD4F_41285 [Streptomyces aureus]